MKKGELKDLKNKPKEELQKMLRDLESKVRTLSFDVLYGKEKNVKSVKNTKKTIARILTYLNQKNA